MPAVPHQIEIVAVHVHLTETVGGQQAVHDATLGAHHFVGKFVAFTNLAVDAVLRLCVE